MLKQIKKSAEIRILLDCSFEKIENVIRQADEIGLVSDYHNYIITSLVSFIPFEKDKSSVLGSPKL